MVVTHHPDAGFPRRLSRITPQVGATVVVDNTANDTGPVLGDLTPPAVTVIRNGRNLGIARALNLGVARALALGCAWALLLDQDTEVDADMVAALLAAQAACPDPGRTAIVGSRFRDTHGRPDEALRLEAQGALWQEVESAITSGSLLSLRAYAAIGPFRDDFFIDYVDAEYCLRARAAGYRVIETRRPLMSHTVGAPSRHRLMRREKWTTNHSADRRYYIARNNTVLLREYGIARGSWRMKSVVRCLRLCKRIAFFERDKRAKIAAVCQGWWHGMRGKLGPRPR